MIFGSGSSVKRGRYFCYEPYSSHPHIKLFLTLFSEEKVFCIHDIIFGGMELKIYIKLYPRAYGALEKKEAPTLLSVCGSSDGGI